MTKKTINKITLFTALGFGAVVLLASCTANFCTNKDKAKIMYTYDTGTTIYLKDKPSDWDEEGKYPFKEDMDVGNIHVYYYQGNYNEDNQNYLVDYNDDPSKTITDVVVTCKANKIACPNPQYWFEMDKKAMQAAIDANIAAEADDRISVDSLENFKLVLTRYGYIKFQELQHDDGTNSAVWDQWNVWTQDLRNQLGFEACPNTDFTNVYQSFLNTKVNNIRSCITITGGVFGNFGYNHNKVELDGINWGQAWGRGFLEGLLVFPISAMVESFSQAFGMNGGGQLGAILLATFIVRTFLLLVSFRTTIGQQKMQMLQPELAKIQAKYPNANTNQAQKQRMSQEQMALYKKNKINPLGTLLVLIVQFPLFIGVWGAMQGSASLASDKVMNLYLSDSIWNTLTNTAGMPSNVNGWWTAFGLILLMSVGQFVSMKLPQWMQKHREKKNPQPKLSANPAQDKTQKQMKWFGYIMLVIIIIMGFTLPAGMGVYWFAGALFSILQTVVTQIIISRQMKKKREEHI